MKVLVTGFGFIGSHIVEELLKTTNHQIDVIDNKFRLFNYWEVHRATGHKFKNMNYQIKDIRDKNWMIQHEKYDLIIHTAALINAHEAEEKRQDYIETNIKGTSKIAKLLKPNGKFIFLSSIAAKKSTNFYGITKEVAEMLLKKIFTKNHLLIVRPYNVFGPRQEPPALIAKLFQHIKKGKVFPIKGDGRQKRSFVYVKDLVREIIYLIDKKIKVKEIGSKNNKCVGEVVFDATWIAGFPNYPVKYINASELSDKGSSQCKKPIKNEIAWFKSLKETWNWWDVKWF